MKISTDKSRLPYICPTYIAENGNGGHLYFWRQSRGCHRCRRNAKIPLPRKLQCQQPSSISHKYCHSKCSIIVADMKKDKIHMVDKDCTFRHHVTYKGIKLPRTIYIDQSGNVYVGKWHTDVIQVISRFIVTAVVHMFCWTILTIVLW